MMADADRRASERPPKETRHQARQAALQMLYQWEVGRLSMYEVRQTFWTHSADTGLQLSDELRAFTMSLASGVADSIAEIDPLITDAAEHWRLERMNVMIEVPLLPEGHSGVMRVRLRRPLFQALRESSQIRAFAESFDQ